MYESIHPRLSPVIILMNRRNTNGISAIDCDAATLQLEGKVDFILVALNFTNLRRFQ